MPAMGGRGTRSRFTADVIEQQKDLARKLVADGATWARITAEFYNKGWEYSSSLLHKRVVEWCGQNTQEG